MASKAKHLRIRSSMLQSAEILPKSGRRKVDSVTEPDYAAVPPPLNLRVQPAGNCLIWLWRINSGGYGTGSFPGGEHLAHRQSFTQSRGHSPSANILHLCHRPFCIQPSHLYDGSSMDNSQDRRLRTLTGLDFELFNKKAEIVQSVARYQWASPENAANQPLFTPPVEHDCEFVIPAVDRKICPTCGCDELSDDTSTYFEGVSQPDNTDRNESLIFRSSRSFKDLPGGVTIESSITSEMSIPKTRAERRRRDSKARKSRPSDRPILLGSASGILRPGGPIKLDIPSVQPPIMGPGLIVYTVRPFNGQI